MEIIKKIFLREAILLGIVTIIGLIFANKYILLGISTGCIVSSIGFYMLCRDAKNDLYMRRSGIRIGLQRYLKRFFLYGIYLFLLIKYFDEKMLFSGFIGLMTIKLNILLYILWERLQLFLKKHQKR